MARKRRPPPRNSDEAGRRLLDALEDIRDDLRQLLEQQERQRRVPQNLPPALLMLRDLLANLRQR